LVLPSVDIDPEVLKNILLDLQALNGITKRQDESFSKLQEFLQQWTSSAEVELAWIKRLQDSLVSKGWNMINLRKWIALWYGVFVSEPSR